MSGWVRVHRKLAEHPLWTRHRFTPGQAWVDLILLASYADHVAFQGNRPLPVRRGQVLTSQVKLAARWQWNRETVRSFLRLLTSAKMAAIETSKATDTGYTLITLLNYERQQGDGEDQKALPSSIQSAIEPPFEPASNQHPTAIIKKGNKGKKKYLAGDSAPAGEGKSAGTRKQSDPNVKVLVDLWHDSYAATHGSKPPVNGAKCGQVAKVILRGRPLGEARWLIQEYFRNPRSSTRTRTSGGWSTSLQPLRPFWPGRAS